LEFNVEDRSFGLFVQSSLDAETLKPGLNFTLTTDIGALDILGEVQGVGQYEAVLTDSLTVEMFGYHFSVISIGKLIIAKRAAGRAKT
jgi:hypothetical protein